MEEGRYYGANIRTTDDDGRDPDRKTEESLGVFVVRSSGDCRCEETVGRPLLARFLRRPFLRATREEKRGAERKKRLEGKLEPVNVACQQHGPLTYAINSCVKSDDRP